jgi:hypothetical protein
VTSAPVAASSGIKSQEAVVWLAPFHEMRLPAPAVELSGFHFVPAVRAAAATPAAASGENGHAAAADDDDAVGDDDDTPYSSAGTVEFTVSSSRVAVFTVWEVAAGPQQRLPGHFSDNAVTVHPCEPRKVQFIPRVGAPGWKGYLATAGVHPGQQQQHAGAANLQTTPGGRLLTSKLQQHLVVSSLYDHQLFGGEQKSAGGEGDRRHFQIGPLRDLGVPAVME